MGKSTENTDLENTCDQTECWTSYIKSRLQNEILTASIAQEIEEAGNKNRTQKGSGERQWRNKGKGERVREEGRSLPSTFNEAMMRPVWLVSKMIMNAWCMCSSIYSRLGKTAVNSLGLSGVLEHK